MFKVTLFRKSETRILEAQSALELYSRLGMWFAMGYDVDTITCDGVEIRAGKFGEMAYEELEADGYTQWPN